MKKGADGTLKEDFEYFKFVGTRAEALVEAERLDNLKKSGRIVKEFKPLLEKWLEDRKTDMETDRGLSVTAYEIYYYHVRRLIPAIGDLQLQNATARQIMKRLDLALADLSREYQKRVYTTLRQVIRYAAGEKLMQDISGGLKAPAVRGHKREKKVVPKDDLLDVLDAFKPLKWYLLFRLLVIFGIRISESMGFRWECVNIEKGVIKIMDAVDIRHRKMMGTTKTPASIRDLPLDDETIDLFKQRREEWEKLPEKAKKSDLVFCTDDGRPLHYGTLKKSITSALKMAGMERYTPHEFRHSYITHLKNAGINDKRVMDAAGHACIQSSQPYTHSLKQSINLLDELDLDKNLDKLPQGNR
jgi:integrase